MAITLISLLQFSLLMYIDIKLNLTYYGSIMLDAFKELLCSKLCWHIRPGHTYSHDYTPILYATIV